MTEFELQVLIAPHKVEIEAVAAKYILLGIPGDPEYSSRVWENAEPYISWVALRAKFPRHTDTDIEVWDYIYKKYGPIKKWTPLA